LRYTCLVWILLLLIELWLLIRTSNRGTVLATHLVLSIASHSTIILLLLLLVHVAHSSHHLLLLRVHLSLILLLLHHHLLHHHLLLQLSLSLLALQYVIVSVKTIQVRDKLWFFLFLLLWWNLRNRLLYSWWDCWGSIENIACGLWLGVILGCWHAEYIINALLLLLGRLLNWLVSKCIIIEEI